VRLATGAGRSRIVRQLLTETLLLFIVGGTAGLLVARLMTSLLVLALPTLLSGLLFGVSPLDPVSFGVAIAVFGGTALAACYVPVRRATRIDAVEALRYE
jgi:ABC-type antimicrobial peptide transport system permease subunit